VTARAGVESGGSCRAEPEPWVASFRERGFVVVPGLLSPAELERYGAAVDRAVRERMAGDTRALSEKSRYEQSFQQCMNLWEDFADVRSLTFHPRIAQAAAALLGAPAVRVWHDQALYKEAGGQSTAGHLDQAYWPIAETDTVTAWIPFQDTRPENGGMGYVPGSHRFARRQFANIFSGEGFDLEHGPEARGVAVEFPEIPAGAAAFHHGLTLHMARANPSGRARRVHTVIFFADGCRRASFPAHHPSVDRAGIAVGAPIQSAATPLAWPRAPGDLPVPPAPLDPPRRGWPGWRRAPAQPAAQEPAS
jgi:ectoine hydroxylase-related dioxygenase (phytanoyl-CoA dioxygenase family)